MPIPFRHDSGYIIRVTASPMQKTRFERRYKVSPTDLNGYGIMHGGRLLTVADETAFMSARLHAGGICVTRAIHQAVFHAPVNPDSTIRIEAVVAHTGRTSLWIPVRIFPGDQAEPLLMEAVFVFTALDATGKPRPVGTVLAESESERQLQQRIERYRLEKLA